MLVSKCLNTSLLEVVISSKKEHVFICDFSEHSLQIILDNWWASMKVGSKCPIAWNHSRHVPSWRFYLHCWIKETSSLGIICIICHQVLHHPSEHGTSSLGIQLLAKVHIAKLNKLSQAEVTELPSSTVDETAFAMPKTQGSRGIQILSSQRNITFDFYVLFILTELTDRMLQTGSKGHW